MSASQNKMMEDVSAGPGGFLPLSAGTQPQLTHGTVPTVLPKSRVRPLKPGGSKETDVIVYLDNKLLGISRRFEMRFDTDWDDVDYIASSGKGYKSFGDTARDLMDLLDIVWLSGTREFRSVSALCSSFMIP